jgi:hypothetical protein
MTDPGANVVNLTPQDTTITNLVAFPPPISPTDRVAPVETTTWRIHATIIFARQEKDSDYHLGLTDDQGNTMIAESTSPACGQGSVVEKQIAEVRAALDARYPELSRGRVLSGLSQAATLTGVGFVDRLHRQTDVAPNGFELHPLVAIEFP